MPAHGPLSRLSLVVRRTAMQIRLIFPMLLAVLAMSGCASTGRHDAPPPPEASVVRVEGTHPNGKVAVFSGAVVTGARVATSTEAVRGANEVWVTTAAGRRCRAAGVAGVSDKHFLVLLTVDWGSEPPPPLPTADPLPSGRTDVTVLPGPGIEGLSPIHATASIPARAAGFNVTITRVPDPRYGGSPVIDGRGQLLGVISQWVTGVQVSASMSPVAPTNYFVARNAQTVMGVQSSREIPWSEWASGSR